jgi:anti-sigma factor RsiW
MTERPDDALLVAYLDGELDEAASAALEQRLADDAALKAQLQALTETSLLLRDAFDPVLREPVPLALLRAASGSGGAEVMPFPGRWASLRRPRGWVGMAVAASVTGILLGGGATYLAGWPQPGAAVLATIAGTHRFIIASANAGEPVAFDVPAGAEQRLAIRVPDMTPWGLTFKGARHIVVEGDKSAYTFYFESASKEPEPITLAIWPSSRPDSLPKFERNGTVNQMYWRRSGHGFAITGEANKGYMWNMAQDIVWQLRNN